MNSLKLQNSWCDCILCAIVWITIISSGLYVTISDGRFTVISVITLVFIPISIRNLSTQIPRNYILFNQEGITCVKKQWSGPSQIQTYSWVSLKELAFCGGKIYLHYSHKNIPEIVCQEYYSMFVKFNGNLRFCFPTELFPYIEKICKDNNIPCRKIPYRYI